MNDTPKDLKKAYKTIVEDNFPPRLEVAFVSDGQRQTLFYEKVTWAIGGRLKGLRYGENPGQEAALYKLVNGNLILGEVSCIQPGRWLASDPELLQFGKHPGKINITDADNALNILRYLDEKPCAVIVKHNNPCGVALGDTPAEAYHKANNADRLAAFGGCIALNRACDRETAKLVAEQYAEVIVAPEFEEGVLEILAGRKNLRIMKIGNLARIAEYAPRRTIDFKSLIDGGLILQWSFVPETRTPEGLLPAETVHKGEVHRIRRLPDAREKQDLLFGWLVESGVTSNSVLYVKDQTTVGIGAGEQDRVGVAEIARDKAYRKLADRLSWERGKTPYNLLKDEALKSEIDAETRRLKGGLIGSCMVSDAFFPFRDGVDVGIREGVSAVIQPGGSLRDYEVIDACNEAGVAMVFTGQRSFRH